MAVVRACFAFAIRKASPSSPPSLTDVSNSERDQLFPAEKMYNRRAEKYSLPGPSIWGLLLYKDIEFGDSAYYSRSMSGLNTVVFLLYDLLRCK